MATTRKRAQPTRTFDARPDTPDFRDLMYTATLVEVPSHIPLSAHRALRVPVLDQGTEGACTGFALATVAHSLLRRRRVDPDRAAVSPRMLYDMARRYDAWDGEDYAGSDARGAMKGWHKHGVCSARAWPYRAGDDAAAAGLDSARAADALKRPLGAYFRVNHRDLVAMHAALAEVGVLFATVLVHSGWSAVGANGRIEPRDPAPDGHAVAIVAYDDSGFWFQNSWGRGWGHQGFGHIRYADWLAHGTDVWVARLGAPVQGLQDAPHQAEAAGRTGATPATLAELRPHVVNVGNDGWLEPKGAFGMNEANLRALFANDVRRALRGWQRPRILLHAHGGLVPEAAALQRLQAYRPVLMAQQVYPLAFVWHSDYWTTLRNVLQDALRRKRSEGLIDRAKDFMLDRLDDLLEPLARAFSGKASWDEMKENAIGASLPGRAAALVLEELHALKAEFPKLELHLSSHSAGAVLQAGVADQLNNHGQGPALNVRSCTWWAPACTHALFESHYLPALQAGTIERAALYMLNDKAEQDDNCARIYNKSLLYLVSNAFEARARIPLLRDGVPLMGLQKFLHGTPLEAQVNSQRIELIVAPTTATTGPAASGARAHGDFDDDEATVAGSFARIVGLPPAGAAARAARPRALPPAPPLQFQRSQASLRAQRLVLDERTR